MSGVYENYLSQKMPDPNMVGVTEALEWFCFSDRIQRFINQRQNYAVYPYLQYGFVIWHFLFATMAWPKITFPNKGFEVSSFRVFAFSLSWASLMSQNQQFYLGGGGLLNASNIIRTPHYILANVRTLLKIHDIPETHLDFNYPERNIITIPHYTFLPASFYTKYGLTSTKPI